jgi:predicted dehydrogenase
MSFAAGDATIKVALVGCGFRGTGAVAQALLTKGPIKLWAMADLFADRVESSRASLVRGLAADYDREQQQGLGEKIDVPPERRFVGFDAYQKAIDSGVDLVILATHQHFRPEHFAYTVKQGKHVFMEKPLGVDVPGIRQVLAANEEAKKKNLKVGVGLYMRYSRRVLETLARVREGAIGPVALMCCYFNMPALRDTPPRPADMTEMTYQLRNPYHFVWLSGDYLVDAVVHYFDLCLWLHGGHPATAQGQGGRQLYLPTQQGDTFDHQAVEYTFEDGVKMFAQTRQISGCWVRSTAQVYGPKGCADLFGGKIEGESPWHIRGAMPNPYQVEHDALVDAIRNDKPHNEADHAATATLVGIMGRMASYSGQTITWEQVMESNVSLSPEKYAFDATPPVVPDRATGRYPVAIPGVYRLPP